MNNTLLRLYAGHYGDRNSGHGHGMVDGVCHDLSPSDPEDTMCREVYARLESTRAKLVLKGSFTCRIFI
ncbi:hypothetical protein TNCV_1338621 [Trichonephila clavipes]|nr:hypothetical protein TNCV_1338621 [Trichonephila clavipes]